MLPTLEEDDRLIPMLNTLSKRYLGQDYDVKKIKAGQVTADMLDGVSSAACAESVHEHCIHLCACVLFVLKTDLKEGVGRMWGGVNLCFNWTWTTRNKDRFRDAQRTQCCNNDHGRFLPFPSPPSRTAVSCDIFCDITRTSCHFSLLLCCSQLAKKDYPLCALQLHQSLRAHHHLRHHGRQQYGLFLKGIGLSLEEALKFWRAEFSKVMDGDKVSGGGGGYERV